MLKFIVSLFVASMGIAGYASTLLEADFTKDTDSWSKYKFSMRNIKVVKGDDGGIIAEKAGKYAALSCPANNFFNPDAGTITLEIAPVVDIESFKGAKEAKSMTLMEIVGQGNLRLSIGAVMDGGYQTIGMNYLTDTQKINKHQVIKWVKGEKHLLAFIWDKEHVIAKIDGNVLFDEKPVANMFMPHSLIVCGYNNSVFLIRKFTITDNQP